MRRSVSMMNESSHIPLTSTTGKILIKVIRFTFLQRNHLKDSFSLGTIFNLSLSLACLLSVWAALYISILMNSIFLVFILLVFWHSYTMDIRATLHSSVIVSIDSNIIVSVAYSNDILSVYSNISDVIL